MITEYFFLFRLIVQLNCIFLFFQINFRFRILLFSSARILQLWMANGLMIPLLITFQLEDEFHKMDNKLCIWPDHVFLFPFTLPDTLSFCSGKYLFPSHCLLFLTSCHKFSLCQICLRYLLYSVVFIQIGYIQ
jgi:hypothetical protein